MHMRATVMILTLSTFLLTIGVAAAAEPDKQTVKWVVDAEDTRCTLTRVAPGADELILKAIVDPLDNRTSITLLFPGRQSDLVRSWEKAELVLAPGGKRFQGNAAPSHGESEPGYGIRFSGTDQEIPAVLARSSGLAIWVKGRQIGAIQFSNAQAPMKALQQCNDDYLRSVGIDPATIAALQKRPQPLGDGSIAQWVFDEDYPKDALQARAEGTTTIRFTVGIDGRAKDCAILKSAGFKSLDLQTCYLFLSRGRFSPAIDKDGHPTEAPLITPLRWILRH